jgi:uncharacterized Rmd1/YagE family protein
VSEPLFGGKKSVRAHAVLLGERLDVRALEVTDPIASAPLTVTAAENGVAVLFRWGAVVVFNLAGVEEAGFLSSLQALVGEPITPETERAEVRLADADKDERAAGGVISLREINIERLQIVAEVLAKSVVLAYYERSIAKVFDRIEPLAQELQTRGRISKRVREVLRDIGGTLLIQHRMVGRVEITDKPDVLWEHPELEPLYVRIVDEYEIRERSLALERKIQLISNTASTLVDLLQHNRSHRVEWYIVILIVVELALTLWDRFVS